MSKLIIIAGIKRSGSTWLYNAVRLMLKHAGYSIAGGGLDAYDEACEADYQIIKTHPFNKQLAERADYVFTSDRDDDGIRASWERFVGKELEYERLILWRRWLQQWDGLDSTCYMMEYEDLVSRLPSLAVDVVDVFIDDILPDGSQLDLGSYIDEIHSLTPPTDRDYDPETLLFRNHITS